MDLMFLVVMVILLLFVEIYVCGFYLWNLFINSNKKSDILKTKEKRKIMLHNIVDYNVMHTMRSRIINSVQ